MRGDESTVRLQWGRTREGAEGCAPYLALCQLPPMLQWGRTREGAEGPLRHRAPQSKQSLLQWGRTREGAEGTTTFTFSPLELRCFSGAAPVKVRKASNYDLEESDLVVASVGPHP